MSLKIKNKVRCSDRDVGDISHVIMNTVTKEISHLVVRAAGGGEVLVPIGDISSSDDATGVVTLRKDSSEFSAYPAFQRGNYLELGEVEIAHAERDLHHVQPGHPLIEIPELERDVSRRKFFTNLTNAIGVVLALPLAIPILRYITDPMYQPLDNTWLQLGDVSALEVDQPQLIRFTKKVREGYLSRQFKKSHWVVKPSDELREQIYGGESVTFEDSSGKQYWENDLDGEVVVMSGKCPHLGCAFKWKENHRKFGKVFWCPCHLSIYDAAGKVLDGPAPRRLDILPVRTNSAGRVEIIDAEFKAGKHDMIRII